MFHSIYLTGFKKFGGISVNPTELIVDQFLQKQHPNIKKVTKLDVTVEQVDKYLDSLKPLLENDNSQRILNLHLGVGPNKQYYLESCGYNKKDFGIPDNSGKVFNNQKICQKISLDQSLKTKVDLEYLASKLGKKYDVTISNDPGRYLCNYIYFNSLNKFCELEHSSSLFVHIPYPNIKSHQENMKFIENLIKLLINKE